MSVEHGGRWLAVLLVLACVGACDPSNSSCEEALDRFYSGEMIRFPMPDWSSLEPAEAVAYCEATQAEAEAVGCGELHSRFRSCIAHPDARCHREHLAFLACIAGEPYEYECNDGTDDDGDGRVDCADSDCFDIEPCVLFRIAVPQGTERALDILVVLDTAVNTILLREELGAALTDLLREPLPGYQQAPDLHLGVISADLGTGYPDNPDCPRPAGDDGRLLTGSCDLGGVPYLVDVAPRGCQVELVDYQFLHDCTAEHCLHEPGTSLIETTSGRPRCRNLPLADLQEGIGCLLHQGTDGCVFRQPLEAMRRALDGHPNNVGFLRSGAVLSVIIVTSTDDCSAADERLFDPAQTALDSELGPLTPFRCFEFGSTCDVTDRSVSGSWGWCSVNEDPEGLLTPVSDYLAFLDSIKLRERMTLTVVAGVDSEWPFYGEVNVGQDSGVPQLNPSCTRAGVGVTLATRLLHLVDDRHDPMNDDWPLQSMCRGGWLAGLEYAIGDRVETDCPISYPVRGCSDIGAAVGQPADDLSCNDLCRPTCTIREAYYHDTPEEYRLELPACLEVCPDGLCSGNDDPSQAYAGGFPSDRDPALPVTSCWYFYYDPQCIDSAFVTIQIARREGPPPLTIATVDCAWSLSHESLCHDGVDDDDDCLVDCDDPDCASSPSCTE